MSAIIRSIIMCLVLVDAIASAKNIPAPSVQQYHLATFSNITIVEDIRDFAEKHPGMKIIPMTRQEIATPTLSIRYSLGSRTKGDRLVGVGGGNIDTPDVKIPLVYPENGIGSILTFVEIITTQSNNDGNAYVEDGGIGQRFVIIYIEAKSTDYFSFSVKYYGID